jgi:dihydrofolate reductase
MAELTADLFLTLEGHALGEGAGPFFGYPGPELDAWIRDQLGGPQILVMGRVTYQALAAFAPGAGDDGSTRMTELPKVVFSNSLTEPLAWSNTRLMAGGLAEGIGALKRESAEPLRCIGSISLVRSMIRLGLVDRLRVLVFPLILGTSGREPAFAGYPDVSLELAGVTVLDSRLTLLEYRPGAAG